jgi:hypothetical protein
LIHFNRILPVAGGSLFTSTCRATERSRQPNKALVPRSPTFTSSRPYPRLHEAIAACVARADRRAIKELDGNTPLQIHLASCRGPDLPGLSPAARSAVASRMSTARGFAYLLDSTESTSNMASHPARLQYKARRTDSVRKVAPRLPYGQPSTAGDARGPFGPPRLHRDYGPICAVYLVLRIPPVPPLLGKYVDKRAPGVCPMPFVRQILFPLHNLRSGASIDSRDAFHRDSPPFDSP